MALSDAVDKTVIQVDGIVNRDTYRYAGNHRCGHVQPDAQKSHDDKNNDDGGDVWNHANERVLNRSPQTQHQ